MSLTITKVSGAQAAVCEVNTNGVVSTGCWIGPGVRPVDNQKIQISGWSGGQTTVQVWTTQGASSLAYRADEATATYVVLQSAGPGGPKQLWQGPVATTNLALTVNEDGSLSMATA